MAQYKIPSNLHAQNDSKFRELIVYFSEKCASDPNFGATKLNKLLFYADFLHYQRTGKPITGHTYQKLEHGPAPRALKPILASMANVDVAVEEKLFHGKTQKRTRALRQANTDIFSPEEMTFIDGVISACWGMSAKGVSEQSHKFIGWIAAGLNETIPYEIALVSFGPLTPKELAHGKRLEERARELAAAS